MAAISSTSWSRRCAEEPLSERVQDIGFRIGLAAVLMLMIFATWNDIIHLSSL